MKKGVIMKKYKISIKKMKIYVNVVQDFEIYMKNKSGHICPLFTICVIML